MKSDPRGEKLTSERSLSSHDLQLPSNRAWIFTAEELSFVFAFNYDFASWFEEVCSCCWSCDLKFVADDDYDGSDDDDDDDDDYDGSDDDDDDDDDDDSDCAVIICQSLILTEQVN